MKCIISAQPPRYSDLMGRWTNDQHVLLKVIVGSKQKKGKSLRQPSFLVIEILIVQRSPVL